MPEEATPTKKKKGFGEKLKGIGRAIGRGVKKAPGAVYREVVIPEFEHIRGKFTEPVVRKPTVRRTPLPGSAELSKAYRTGVEPYKPPQRTKLKRGPTDTVEPFRAEQRTRLKRKPGADRARAGVAAQYKTKGGAKGVPIPRPGETINSPSYRQRIAKQKAQEKAAARQARLQPRKPQTKAEKRTPLTAGTVAGETVTVIGKLPPQPKPTVKGMTPTRKRKFSAKRTTKTVGEAAKASQKDIEIERLDTTAQEVARMMTEQDIAREAQRVESTLKEDRTPRREKARYRYRTRGVRSENRGR